MINPRRAPWEEQAFAEDASGFFGGCVWPPKSYYCSFCRREFASAQALGGHMNVHRREKARLRVRQSSSIPQTEVVPQNDALNPWTSFDAPYLHSNPKPEEVSDTRSLVSPSLPVFQRNHKNSFVSSPLASWSSSFAEKRDGVSDSIKKEEKRSTIVETVSRAEKEDFITEDLSLNLIFCKKQTKTSSKEEVVGCKRRRTEEKPFCFFPKLSAIADRCLPQSEVFELRSGSVEELDLELRLGDGSKLN